MFLPWASRELLLAWTNHEKFEAHWLLLLLLAKRLNAWRKIVTNVCDARQCRQMEGRRRRTRMRMIKDFRMALSFRSAVTATTHLTLLNHKMDALTTCPILGTTITRLPPLLD